MKATYYPGVCGSGHPGPPAFWTQSRPTGLSRFTGASSWLPCRISRLRGLSRPYTIRKAAQQAQEECAGGCFCQQAHHPTRRQLLPLLHPLSAGAQTLPAASLLATGLNAPLSISGVSCLPQARSQTHGITQATFSKGAQPSSKPSNGSVLSQPSAGFQGFLGSRTVGPAHLIPGNCGAVFPITVTSLRMATPPPECGPTSSSTSPEPRPGAEVYLREFSGPWLFCYPFS